MDLSQTTPKALMQQRRDEIIETIRNEPNTTYLVIAERFGVSQATVCEIALKNGISRKSMKEDRIDRLPAKGKPREGGIIANDEQWLARMQRIND
jgi:hypothetical protein